MPLNQFKDSQTDCHQKERCIKNKPLSLILKSICEAASEDERKEGADHKNGHLNLEEIFSSLILLEFNDCSDATLIGNVIFVRIVDSFNHVSQLELCEMKLLHAYFYLFLFIQV
jgi:hypothetical protein